MKAFAIFTLGLIFTLAVSGWRAAQATAETREQVRQEAEKLWEQAVTAKGGRERLYGVRNFVVSSNSRYGQSPRADVATGIVEENLYVLPGKWWSFRDYRPGKLGYGVNLLDFERNTGWISSGGRPPVPVERRDLFDDFKYRFRQAQFIYLLETETVKPTLIKARSAFVGFKKFDVIETTIDGARVDFYLDRKTHLPVRIVTGATPGARATGKLNYTVRLDDYIDIDGIRMPQKVSYGDADNRTTYHINVAYNQRLFERPPTSDMGRESWKESAE